MAFNWLYTTWNDNEYILFLIIVILFFIIVDFKLIKRKKDNFFNLPEPSSTSEPSISTPITTTYKPPVITNPGDSLFVSDEEKEKWRKAWVQLDGNEETLSYLSNTAVSNDIIQFDSTLYSSPNTSNVMSSLVDYSKNADWATIDDLGKSLTDTLGGVNSNLGYTILQEQLGTFKPNYANPNAYDNTQNYKTSMNPSTIAGTNALGYGGNYQQVGKSPVFMQKDFAGVANIFAPNIYVSNAPLNDNGIPDISFSNGDGGTYTV